MGLFNNTRAFIDKVKANQAQQQATISSMQSNPSSTMGDYIKAGVNPIQALASISKQRTNTNVARGNQLQPNAISPTAFSNQETIGGVFGQANPGTFTRSCGNTPLMQMTSQGYIPPIDPTNPTEQNDVNAIMAGTDGALQGYSDAQMPPMGVQTPITPTYDLNSQ